MDILPRPSLNFKEAIMRIMEFGDREFSIVGFVVTEEFGLLPVLDIPMIDEQKRPDEEQLEVEEI